MHEDRTSAKSHEAANSAPNPAAEEKEQSLRGTFVSVLLLGAFLALVWVGIFVLFIARD